MKYLLNDCDEITFLKMVEQNKIVGHLHHKLILLVLTVAVLFRLLFNQSEFQAEVAQQVKNFHHTFIQCNRVIFLGEMVGVISSFFKSNNPF